MDTRLVDRMVQTHMALGTVPHPPTYPVDAQYAAAYEVVVNTLAGLRSTAPSQTPEEHEARWSDFSTGDSATDELRY